MKRPTRPKEESLARKRALIRALIEQTGLAASHGQTPTAIRQAAANVEYVWGPRPGATGPQEPESDAEAPAPSNIIPFPGLRRER